MFFENSPKLGEDNPSARLSFLGWASRHMRFLIGIIGVMVLVDFSLAVYSLSFRQPPGGLDGCVQSTNGSPLQVIVQVDDEERPTYADGCFFFPALAPGPHHLSIKIDDKPAWEREVQIVSGQANALETVTLIP